MSLIEISSATAEWENRGLAWAEAILVGVKRSAPRPPGARFAAATDGSVAGTISAGCVESDLREHLLESLRTGATRLVNYGISDEQALGVGLSCGGEIEVLIRPSSPGDAVWAAVLDLLRDGRAGALLTGLSGAVQGQRMLVTQDGERVGSLGPDGESLVTPHSIANLLRTEGGRSLETARGFRAFLDPILPPRHLVIVGATPVAAALTGMALACGFRVTIVDPREGLARPESFPGAALLRLWPDEALAELALDSWTDVAVLAHDDRLDVPALAAALMAGCRYVGLLGGRRTQRLRREALEAEGIAKSEMARIRGPIGLDIGASTPAEIAVAILSEILGCRLRGLEPGDRRGLE